MNLKVFFAFVFFVSLFNGHKGWLTEVQENDFGVDAAEVIFDGVTGVEEDTMVSNVENIAGLEEVPGQPETFDRTFINP